MADEERDLIERVASVLGHELRNPLAVINNSAYFVRAKLGPAGLDPKVEKHLKVIESEVARADSMIGDMLTFAKPHEAEAEEKPFDAAVRAALAGYEGPQGFAVAAKYGAKDAKVKIDEAAFANSLECLLDNALQAMGGKGSAKVVTGAGPSSVFVTVSDSGGGVDPKLKDTLFDPFVTSKPRGLGLGLALARKLLGVVGGEISYESTAKGSIFRITLPKA